MLALGLEKFPLNYCLTITMNLLDQAILGELATCFIKIVLV